MSFSALTSARTSILQNRSVFKILAARVQALLRRVEGNRGVKSFDGLEIDVVYPGQTLQIPGVKPEPAGSNNEGQY